jgi:phage terminase Nu1 subunit (DNA packaging protein)
MSGKNEKYREPQFEGEVANVTFMCELLDCDQTQVNRYSRQGYLAREGWGSYNWRKSVPMVIGHLRAQAAGYRSQDGADAIKANVGLKAAQERLTQIRADQLAGKLISLEEIEAAFDEVMVNVRQAVLAIPGRVRFGLPHITAHDQKVIAQVCNDVLEETASGKAPIPRGE